MLKHLYSKLKKRQPPVNLVESLEGGRRLLPKESVVRIR